MGQIATYTVELVIIILFVGTLFFRAEPEKRNTLARTRKIGCVTGGCLLPLLLFLIVVINAKSAYDLGGPLFWPITAAYFGALGFVVATFYFLVVQRKKQEV